MARLLSSGFELNSTSTDVELSFAGTDGAGIQNIVTSPVRSGSYSYHTKLSATSNFCYGEYQFSASVVKGVFFARAYIYVTTLPEVSKLIFGLTDNAHQFGINLTELGTLRVMNGFSPIGSDSSALSLNTWYRIELKVDNSGSAGSHELTALLNGSQFASSTTLTLLGSGVNYIFFGWNAAGSNSAETNWDDIALNDSTGSFQNSWPGAGSIIHLQPPATLGAGDSTLWTPDTGSNFARVREVTPDDATSYVQDSTLNHSDLYKLVASGIGASDTVNVVQVGVRFRNDVADATTAFKVQAEKAPAGTIALSSPIIANSTTWQTNAPALPHNYPLTLHQDPDNVNWTQATLDTMQIGVKTTAVGTNKNQVSTIWALVDSTPAAGTTTSTSTSSTSTSSTSSSTSTSSTSSSTSTSSTSSSTSTSSTSSSTSISTSTSTSSTSTSTSSTSSSTSSTSSSTSTTTIAPGTIRAATTHRWHRMSPLARVLGV